MLEQLTELRETCLPVYYVIKDMIKDTGEQPDKEIHRVKSGTVPRTGASVPVDLGCATLLAHTHVHQPRGSLNPVLLEFLWRFHHVGMIDD